MRSTKQNEVVKRRNGSPTVANSSAGPAPQMPAAPGSPSDDRPRAKTNQSRVVIRKKACVVSKGQL